MPICTRNGQLVGSRSNRPALVALALVVCLVFVTGCATYNGRSQVIEVTSNPPKAKVFVNGKQISVTPAKITAKRRSPISIRLEKEGFEPAVIELKRGLNGWLFGNLPLVWMGVASYALQHRRAWIAAPVVGVPIIGLDFLTGAAFKHSPTKIEVKLFGMGDRRVTP